MALLCYSLLCSCDPTSKEPGGAEAPEPGTASFTGGFVVSADGVRIHYRAGGSGDPVLVFVHGWSCDGGYWDQQVRYFSPRHRVVTIDLAGHGDSGLDRQDWSILAFARDVQAVVEELDLRHVILLGHSMGGPVILEAARLMPERLRALIPVDALQNAEQHYDAGEIGAFLEVLREDFRKETEAFVRAMFPQGADPSLVERVASDMAASPPGPATAMIEAVLGYDPKPALRQTRVPIRAIVSEKYPAKTEVNRRYAPQFEAVTVPGTGHFLMLEAAQAFNQRLEETLADLRADGP